MAVRLYLSRVAVLSLRSYHWTLQGAFPGCPAALVLVVWSPRRRGHARRVSDPVSWVPSIQLPAEPRLLHLLRASRASRHGRLCSPRPPQPGHGYSLSKPRAKLGTGGLPFAPDLTPVSPSCGMEKLKLNRLDRREGLKCPPYSPSHFSSNSLVESQRIAKSRKGLRIPHDISTWKNLGDNVSVSGDNLREITASATSLRFAW